MGSVGGCLVAGLSPACRLRSSYGRRLPGATGRTVRPPRFRSEFALTNAIPVRRKTDQGKRGEPPAGGSEGTISFCRSRAVRPDGGCRELPVASVRASVRRSASIARRGPPEQQPHPVARLPCASHVRSPAQHSGSVNPFACPPSLPDDPETEFVRLLPPLPRLPDAPVCSHTLPLPVASPGSILFAYPVARKAVPGLTLFAYPLSILGCPESELVRLPPRQTRLSRAGFRSLTLPVPGCRTAVRRVG